MKCAYAYRHGEAQDVYECISLAPGDVSPGGGEVALEHPRVSFVPHLSPPAHFAGIVESAVVTCVVSVGLTITSEGW